MDADIEKLKEFLAREPSVIFAYLFGSRITNRINGMSDWDIGVYFAEETLDKDTWHDFRIAGRISQIVKGEVEITALNKPLTPLLGFEIIGKGMLLVNKDNELRLDCENRLMRNYYGRNYCDKRTCTK